MRLVFAGTPEFAATHLQAVLPSRHQVVAVYTQPDRPAGRGHKLVSSPVKRLALEHRLPVHQPASLKEPEAQRQLTELAPDILVVVAYGLILPPKVLAIPRHGCINSHASLLPRWRGAAPIARAIEAGDSVTGVTLMRMEEGLDTGPILDAVQTPIYPDDTAESLLERLASLGSHALVKALDALEEGDLPGLIQDQALATYAQKLTKEEAELDWRRPARELERRIRAFYPWPVCHTELAGERLKVLAAENAQGAGAPGEILRVDRSGMTVACGDEALCLTRLQLPGKKPLAVAELLNSRRQQWRAGAVLGR